MEERNKSILKIYKHLIIAILIINVWCFYVLNKRYEINTTKLMNKVVVIEKEILEGINRSITNDVEDLREYITTQFPKVLEKDIEVIVSEVNKNCLKHDLPFSLVVGLIDVESSYNKLAKSNKSAYGLMQIRYDVWKSELGIRQRKDLYRIKVSIRLGTTILKYYVDQNDGDMTKALQDYNGSCDGKFSDKVYKAAKKFTDFRLAYENDGIKSPDNKNTCEITVVSTQTAKVKPDGKNKRGG